MIHFAPTFDISGACWSFRFSKTYFNRKYQRQVSDTPGKGALRYLKIKAYGLRATTKLLEFKQIKNKKFEQTCGIPENVTNYVSIIFTFLEKLVKNESP